MFNYDADQRRLGRVPGFLVCRGYARGPVRSPLSRIHPINRQFPAFLLFVIFLLVTARATAEVTIVEPLLVESHHWRCWYGQLEQNTGIVCLKDSIEQLVPTLVLIPLFAPPCEAGFTSELAQSVMCRPNTGCTTEYIAYGGV